MSKPTLSAKRCILFFLQMFAVLLVFVEFNSCKPKPEPPTVKMNCVRLDYDVVKKWHDSGWTKDSNYIFLESYSADASKGYENMQLVASPAKNYTFFNHKQILPIIHDSCSYNLNGDLHFSINTVKFKKLHLVDSLGRLLKFDYVRFKPTLRKGNHLVFEYDVIADGQSLGLIDSGSKTDPCPDYCPPIEN